MIILLCFIVIILRCNLNAKHNTMNQQNENAPETGYASKKLSGENKRYCILKHSLADDPKLIENINFYLQG